MNIENMFNQNNMNQAAYQAFLNMLMMNPNSSPNQMDINNMLMQYMMMNPNFFQMNANHNNFQNFNAIQSFAGTPQNQQQIIQNGGVMPRPKNINNNLINQDPFPGYIGERINIIFETGTGLKLNFATPLSVSVKDLLRQFIIRVGVSETLLGKKIFFIINGHKIPINEEISCQDFFGKINQVKIIVLDGSNIIGA